MRAWNVALSFGFPVLHTSLCIAKHIYVINSERGQGGGMGKKEERDRIHSSHGMSVIASTRFLRSGHFLCSVSPCFPGTAARVSTDNYLKVCLPTTGRLNPIQFVSPLRFMSAEENEHPFLVISNYKKKIPQEQ